MTSSEEMKWKLDIINKNPNMSTQEMIDLMNYHPHYQSSVQQIQAETYAAVQHNDNVFIGVLLSLIIGLLIVLIVFKRKP